MHTHARKVFWFAAVFAVLAAFPQKASAQDPIHKMGRGLTNLLTCWIEIPKQLHIGGQEDNPVVGVGMGAAKGVGLAVLRLGVGLYEAVTFPLSYPDQFASPYESMEIPDYAWE